MAGLLLNLDVVDAGAIRQGVGGHGGQIEESSLFEGPVDVNTRT